MEAQSVQARQRSDFSFASQAEPLHPQTSARPGEDCEIPTGVKGAVKIIKKSSENDKGSENKFCVEGAPSCCPQLIAAVL